MMKSCGMTTTMTIPLVWEPPQVGSGWQQPWPLSDWDLNQRPFGSEATVLSTSVLCCPSNHPHSYKIQHCDWFFSRASLKNLSSRERCRSAAARQDKFAFSLLTPSCPRRRPTAERSCLCDVAPCPWHPQLANILTVSFTRLPLKYTHAPLVTPFTASTSHTHTDLLRP